MMPMHAQDGLELLQADHDSIRQLFAAYRELAAQPALSARRKALAEQICLALTIHARLEEELLYPLARDVLHDDDLLDDAETEHASCRDLIAQLLATGTGDALHDAKLAVLAEYVEHHALEEERALFPRLRSAGIDTAKLGRCIAERRQELEAVPEALREDALVSLVA